MVNSKRKMVSLPAHPPGWGRSMTQILEIVNYRGWNAIQTSSEALDINLHFHDSIMCISVIYSFWGYTAIFLYTKQFMIKRCIINSFQKQVPVSKMVIERAFQYIFWTESFRICKIYFCLSHYKTCDTGRMATGRTLSMNVVRKFLKYSYELHLYKSVFGF